MEYLGVIKRQSRGPLPRGFFGRKFFQSIFALGAYVSWHADDKVWHQAQYCMLCGVDGSGDVQATFGKNANCRLVDVSDAI